MKRLPDTSTPNTKALDLEFEAVRLSMCFLKCSNVSTPGSVPFHHSARVTARMGFFMILHNVILNSIKSSVHVIA